MFGFIKQVFIVLLSFRGSLATKCISLNNEPCLTNTTIIDLNPGDLIQGQNQNYKCKNKNVNLNVVNMITINELKTLPKYISSNCRFIFDCKKGNVNKKWNRNKC